MAKWTVMIFMGADGVDGNKSLEAEADSDIEELKRVPANPELDIFVERHGGGTAERFRLAGKQRVDAVSRLSASPEAFTSGIALTDFIDWATQDITRPRDQYSMLVLWGHAYRFAIGHTQTKAGIDALDFAELRTVLSRYQERKQRQWKIQEPPQLDVVAFDSCSIATLEMAYQIAPYAKFLIASQVGMPLPGWPYHRIFERLADKMGSRVMGPAEFGSYAVRRFCEHYRALDRTVSLSHLNLQHARGLSTLTDVLAAKLAIAMDDDAEEQLLTSRLFEFAQTGDDEPFVDVLDLCRFLARYSGSAEVRLAARALGDALSSPTAVGPGKSATGDQKPFVVEHGSNSIAGAGLHGVSLYAPHVAPGHDFGAASHFYEKMVFARETLWRDLVRALALPNQICC